MSSLGKATMALVAGTQETTLALANLNFDFSLFRVDAPAEYKTIGERLSPRRRDAAETGAEHVIARRLGALFSGHIPATPNLIRAYGIRASEIIKSTTDGSHESSHGGLFQEWTGPDATSIWAAATSGNGAIAIHMLACLLARIWSASEAESIWDEIIQTRKDELKKGDPTDPLKSFTELAQIDISREQVSAWDSSARAWLEIADSAKLRQQKQLLLLTQKAKIPISGSGGVYASVMEAWRTALVAMENMVLGMPQSIQDGSVILALTSWHLYPDLYALEAGPNRIALNDVLIPPSGVVTLGLSAHRSQDQIEGVHWSLPLAFLKYYGDPVASTTVLDEACTRLSLSEFFMVVLGSIFSTWGPCRHDISSATKIIFEIGETLMVVGRGTTTGGTARPWPYLLADTAEKYISSSGIERKHFKSLIMRGIRRCDSFLADPKDHPMPFFGLANVTVLIGIIPDSNYRVALLREIASEILGGTSDNLLIRYRQDKVESDSTKEDEAESFFTLHERKLPQISWIWEYASALPKETLRRKRKRQTQPSDLVHSRWVGSARSLSKNELSFDLDALDALEEIIPTASPSFTVGGALLGLESRARYEFVLGDPHHAAIFKLTTSEVAGSSLVEAKTVAKALHHRWVDTALLGMHLELLDVSHDSKGPYLTSLRALGAAAESYKLMPTATITTGIFSTCLSNALWVLDCQKRMLEMEASSRPRSGEISRCRSSRPSHESLSTNHVSESESESEESNACTAPKTNVPLSQWIMSKGSLTPSTTLDPRVTFSDPWAVASGDGPNPLGLSDNAMYSMEMDELEHSVTSDKEIKQNQTEITSYLMSRPQSFACIAMFENHDVNLDPQGLNEVMALSSGNSIYVATPLICDPIDQPNEHEIKRIVGNIGKPGISLMIPPMDPKVHKIDESKWSHISHVPFDGRLDDAFQHTSLHLSFTRYKLPVMVAHGYQSIAANFVETPVSIFDRNTWIADLDILKALKSRQLERRITRCCDHDEAEKSRPAFPLTSIDSWLELLDLPPNASVFRARNNWLARLAGAALSLQIGAHTVVLPSCETVCWKCIGESWKGDLSCCDFDNKPSLPLFVI
ncbi:hypothetical protein FNAPI_11603 [Fusarium napiforme]|uniref:Uncharacterized protein n=1 Tax=Fusarium napiforme TaxID=42672 RepID=A0A8H5MPM7_9HYPO|nr:hypothetical protein FNAPI_11603 [Fusarium napiforme]